jgi:uncharacterized protein YbjT (DUF2867 family)
VPILVVGADHPLGNTIVKRLLSPGREVRAFVSDAGVGAELKTLGAKVAIGDLSDESHVAAAATRCFAVAFIASALTDGRELAFLTPAHTVSAWARAAAESRVTRVIWVGSDPPPTSVPELAIVDTTTLDDDGIVEEVVRLDDLAKL